MISPDPGLHKTLWLWTVAALLLTLPTITLAQAHGVPRTSWGAPDLQGVWDTRTRTPLERPDALTDTPMLTPEEAAFFLERQNVVIDAFPVQTLNADWADLREAGLAEGGRSSLIIAPPDGKLPARTAVGQRRKDTLDRPDDKRSAGGPEDRTLAARCIVRRSVPAIPAAYNSNLRILQTAGYVVVLHEMIHEAMIIPLDGRPHLPKDLAQWHGDGRGRWDGDTLVVETTNFHPTWTYEGTGPNARFIERFTLLDTKTLRYEFTVDDAESFIRPWTARFDMTASDGPMYEYACHEGNYGMFNLLRGARVQEKAVMKDSR